MVGVVVMSPSSTTLYLITCKKVHPNQLISDNLISLIYIVININNDYTGGVGLTGLNTPFHLLRRCKRFGWGGYGGVWVLLYPLPLNIHLNHFKTFCGCLVGCYQIYIINVCSLLKWLGIGWVLGMVEVMD